MGAFPNSTPAPALQTAPMTDQLLGYHLAPSDDLILSVESTKPFGSGVKDLAPWRREGPVPLPLPHPVLSAILQTLKGLPEHNECLVYTTPVFFTDSSGNDGLMVSVLSPGRGGHLWFL